MSVDEAYELADMIEDTVSSLRRTIARLKEYPDEMQAMDVIKSLDDERQTLLEFIDSEYEKDQEALSNEYERMAL